MPFAWSIAAWDSRASARSALTRSASRASRAAVTSTRNPVTSSPAPPATASTTRWALPDRSSREYSHPRGSEPATFGSRASATTGRSSWWTWARRSSRVGTTSPGRIPWMRNMWSDHHHRSPADAQRKRPTRVVVAVIGTPRVVSDEPAGRWAAPATDVSSETRPERVRRACVFGLGSPSSVGLEPAVLGGGWGHGAQGGGTVTNRSAVLARLARLVAAGDRDLPLAVAAVRGVRGDPRRRRGSDHPRVDPPGTAHGQHVRRDVRADRGPPGRPRGGARARRRSARAGRWSPTSTARRAARSRCSPRWRGTSPARSRSGRSRCTPAARRSG